MFNKTAKKLFVSSLTLVFAAATAISSTYAWFTTQTTARLSQIELNVTSGEGFEIRFGGDGATDSDYKQTLKLADFQKAYPGLFNENDEFDLSLNHVTMQATDVENGKATGDKMVSLIEGSSTLGVVYTDADGKSYLSFEIFFRGRGAYNIYLKDTYGWSTGMPMIVPSIFLSGDPESMMAYKSSSAYYDTLPSGQSGTLFTEREKQSISAGETLYAYAIDAARMSLKDLTYQIEETSVDGSEETINKAVLPYKEPLIVKFTDTDKDNTTPAGYGDALDSDGTTHRNYAFEYFKYIKGLNEGDNALQFANVVKQNGGTDEDDTLKEQYFLNKAAHVSEYTISATTKKPSLKLVDGYNPSKTLTEQNISQNPDEPNEIYIANDVIGNGVFYGKLQVRIWLEGWDADTFNAIFSDILRINLGFESEAVAS